MILEKGKCYPELPMEYLSELIKYEGGLTKNKADKGNWYNGELKGTNMGVTFATLLNAKQKGLVPYSVTIETLTKENVRVIYNDIYYKRQYCNKIPNPLSFCVLDCSVNNGRGAGGKLLQRVLNKYLTNPIKTDGGIGPNTLKALQDVLAKGIDITTLCKNYNDLRENYYRAIVNNNPTQSRFLAGWLRRLSDVRKLTEK